MGSNAAMRRALNSMAGDWNGTVSWTGQGTKCSTLRRFLGLARKVESDFQAGPGSDICSCIVGFGTLVMSSSWNHSPTSGLIVHTTLLDFSSSSLLYVVIVQLPSSTSRQMLVFCPSVLCTICSAVPYVVSANANAGQWAEGLLVCLPRSGNCKTQRSRQVALPCQS